VHEGQNTLEGWQTKLDKALSITRQDRELLEGGLASEEDLGRIYFQVHEFVPWENQSLWKRLWRQRTRPRLQVIEGTATTYRYWWPTYGDCYQLASNLAIKAVGFKEPCQVPTPEALSPFLITGAVRVFAITDRQLDDGLTGFVALTLLASAHVEEKEPARPNPGDLIYDNDKIVVPPAD